MFFLNMASNNVCILCGAHFYLCLQHFAMRTSNAYGFSQSGGLFGECQVFAMHYKGVPRKGVRTSVNMRV